MDKNFAVPLPRIQRDSTEHLNKLYNSALACRIVAQDILATRVEAWCARCLRKRKEKKNMKVY